MPFLIPAIPAALAAARALPAISAAVDMLKPSEPKPAEQQEALGKNTI